MVTFVNCRDLIKGGEIQEERGGGGERDSLVYCVNYGATDGNAKKGATSVAPLERKGTVIGKMFTGNRPIQRGKSGKKG